MNRMWTIIFFIILYVITIGVYLFIYYGKKKTVMAITIAAIMSVFVTSGIVFVIPLKQNQKEIIEDRKSKMEISYRDNMVFAKCNDGTEYEVKSMNSEITSGYNSFANDNIYQNVKSEITYKYNYKIWWIIPAYSLKHETNIYFDNGWFSGQYGCKLEKNIDNETIPH